MHYEVFDTDNKVGAKTELFTVLNNYDDAVKMLEKEIVVGKSVIRYPRNGNSPRYVKYKLTEDEIYEQYMNQLRFWKNKTDVPMDLGGAKLLEPDKVPGYGGFA